MDCKRVDQLLVDYLYQELEPALVEPVEAHLKSCSRCAEDLQSFERTRAVVGALEDQEPPPVIGQFLLEEARPLAAAATLVAVLGISFYVYREGLPTDRQPRSDLPLSVAEDHRATIGEASPTTVASADRPAGALAKQGEEAAAPEQVEPEKLEGKLRAVVADNADDTVANALGKGARLADGDGYAEQPRRTKRRPRPTARRRLARPRKAPASYADPYKQAKKSAVASSHVAEEPAAQVRVKAPPAPRDEVQAESQRLRRGLRQQTRRAANISDTGSGGSAVWGNKYRSGRSSVAMDREAVGDKRKRQDSLGGLGQASGPQGFEDDLTGSKPGRAKARSSRTRSAKVEALIVAGTRAVKARRCEAAFQYYNAALKLDGRALSAIVDGLGPCLTRLRGKQQKRFRALAQGVRAERSRRARRATKARAKPAAAPAEAAEVESAK
jgi:hypothetical protein